jgi:hypothetical protein
VPKKAMRESHGFRLALALKATKAGRPIDGDRRGFYLKAYKDPLIRAAKGGKTTTTRSPATCFYS